jgi:hypothetical protein
MKIISVVLEFVASGQADKQTWHIYAAFHFEHAKKAWYRECAVILGTV